MEVAISSMPKNVEQFVMLFDASKSIHIHITQIFYNNGIWKNRVELRKKQISENVKETEKIEGSEIINEREWNRHLEKLCLLGYTGRQDLREHTECVRSASVCASVTDLFSLQLMNTTTC
jgi:hypothetical protein